MLNVTLLHVLQDNRQTDGDTAGGCQYATVVVYLNDVDKGGETVCSLLGASLGPAAWGQTSSALPVCFSLCIRMCIIDPMSLAGLPLGPS